jgi:hypothetical protein
LKGFDKVVWDIVERKDGECPSITFQYDSKDGEEGNVTNNHLCFQILMLKSAY